MWDQFWAFTRHGEEFRFFYILIIIYLKTQQNDESFWNKWSMNYPNNLLLPWSRKGVYLGAFAKQSYETKPITFAMSVSLWRHVRALDRLPSQFSYNFSRHCGFGAGLATSEQPLHYGLDDRAIRVRFPAKSTDSLPQDNFCGTMVTGGLNQPRCEPTAHLYFAPMLTIRESLPPIPHTFSWRNA